MVRPIPALAAAVLCFTVHTAWAQQNTNVRGTVTAFDGTIISVQTRDGKALASSVVGMEHCVKTFHEFTGQPLHVAVRLASLTPAKILGLDKTIGSIAPGKWADLVMLDRDFVVRQVYLVGERVV